MTCFKIYSYGIWYLNRKIYRLMMVFNILTQLMPQALLVSDAGPVETSVAFLFIAAAIIGLL